MQELSECEFDQVADGGVAPAANVGADRQRGRRGNWPAQVEPRAATMTSIAWVLLYLFDLNLDFGSPGWIRTSDHPINSRMLYR
jgi:hypothetical protein